MDNLLAKKYKYKVYKIIDYLILNQGFFYHKQVRILKSMGWSKNAIRYLIKHNFIEEKKFDEVDVNLNELKAVQGIGEWHIKKCIRYYVPTKKYCEFQKYHNFKDKNLEDKVKNYLKNIEYSFIHKENLRKMREEYKKKLDSIPKWKVKKEIENLNDYSKTQKKKLNFILYKYDLFNIMNNTKKIIRKEKYKGINVANCLLVKIKQIILNLGVEFYF